MSERVGPCIEWRALSMVGEAHVEGPRALPSPTRQVGAPCFSVLPGHPCCNMRAVERGAPARLNAHSQRGDAILLRMLDSWGPPLDSLVSFSP